MARNKAISHKDEIIKAAMEILQTEGVNALSIRKIGLRMNVSGMTLYNYIENIDDIKKEIIMEGFRDLYKRGYETLLAVKKKEQHITQDEGCRILSGVMYGFGRDNAHLFELMFGNNNNRLRKDPEIASFHGFFHNLLYKQSSGEANINNHKALNMLDYISKHLILDKIRGVRNYSDEEYNAYVDEFIERMIKI